MEYVRIQKDEIDELKKTINRIENKAYINMFGYICGVAISIFSLIYFMMNPEIISGTLSIIVIGGIIFMINYISYNQRKNRIAELKKDLKKIIEIYNIQNGIKEGDINDDN